MGRRTGNTLLGVVSAVQRAHSQAQRAEQQRLRADDLAQRKERQQQKATLDRSRLEMKKLEMRRRVPSPLTDLELVELVVLEEQLAFQFPLAPEERAEGGRLLLLAIEAQREAEEEAASLLRQEQAAAEISLFHEEGLRMNEQPRLMREYGWEVGLFVTCCAAGLVLWLLLAFSGR